MQRKNSGPTKKMLADVSLDELAKVSGGFEVDGDYWQQRGYGDQIQQLYDAPAGWFGPEDVFPSAPDSNGVEQGGIGIG